MGSYLFDGVTFRVYPEDHEPPHVHGRYQGIVVIIELGQNRVVRLANRQDAVQPRDAKRNHVRHVVSVAAERFDELMDLWREAHA